MLASRSLITKALFRILFLFMRGVCLRMQRAEGGERMGTMDVTMD